MKLRMLLCEVLSDFVHWIHWIELYIEFCTCGFRKLKILLFIFSFKNICLSTKSTWHKCLVTIHALTFYQFVKEMPNLLLITLSHILSIKYVVRSKPTVLVGLLYCRVLYWDQRQGYYQVWCHPLAICYQLEIISSVEFKFFFSFVVIINETKR